MKVLSREEFAAAPVLGGVVVYPTDTVYGIGCSATDEDLVYRVRDAKRRDAKPFSVVASEDWIREHCVLTPEGEGWLRKLPGPYTLILKLKEPESLPNALTMGLDTVGVRIPDHWLTPHLQAHGPFVTTSANLTGEPPITTIDELPLLMRKHVDLAVDDGVLDGTPSTLVRLDKDPVEVVER